MRFLVIYSLPDEDINVLLGNDHLSEATLKDQDVLGPPISKATGYGVTYMTRWIAGARDFRRHVAPVPQFPVPISLQLKFKPGLNFCYLGVASISALIGLKYFSEFTTNI